jgi:non-ribosomal peptide synthetase component F
VLLLTSGTTARPKIVPLTHANICASAYANGAALALRETDRCLNVLPLFHGHGLNATVIASLAAGSSVVCTPGLDGNSFSAWLTAFQPTWYSAVPTMHQAILTQARHNLEPLAKCRLRFVRSSSAPLPLGLLTDLERAFETPVIEWYAMTESTSSPIACNPQPPRQRKPGSVGLPVQLDVAIMDEQGSLLPPGRTGEIVIRGASVMAGYDRDPMTTEDAFAGDWFKTRDHGFFDDDGYLFISGRRQEIINRGGEKIAPREVDEVLLEHPAVAEAVTFAVPHATLCEDVGAAIVLRPGAAATPKDIRQFAIGRVADFKVPRQVLIVPEIPKGPTGKVQRIGLAAKLGLPNSTAGPRDFVAPRTPLEKALAKNWAEILQVEQIGIHDDFFVSGGDSLLATHVLCNVYEMMQVELEILQFFEAPTVAEVAQHLELVMQADQTQRPSSGIVRMPREDGVAPASFVQERLLRLQRALPDIPFLNVLYALRLTSHIDVAILEQSINEIVRRHEILRTTFAVVDGRHVQVIAPQLTIPLAFDDLHKLEGSRKETATRELIQEEMRHSFDLESGPLVRAHAARLTERTHLLLIAMHAIIQDGWSLGVLIQELAALYDAFAAGRESPLAPLPIHFSDFAHWQRRWRSYPDIVAQLDYWREQLHDPLPAMALAKVRPEQTIDDFRTARRKVAWPAKLSEAAKRFSEREGVTLFTTLIAAFKALLHRYTGENDIRVATHVANRNRPRTEGLIGPLVNTVILRTRLGPELSAREVMRRVRATALAAFANQDIPFDEVVATLERENALERARLTQVMIWLQNAPLRPIANNGFGFSFEEVDPGMPPAMIAVTTFDLVLMLRETAQGLVGTCVYNPHLFTVQTIDRLLRHFQEALECMLMEPERPISAIPISVSDKD